VLITSDEAYQKRARRIGIGTLSHGALFLARRRFLMAAGPLVCGAAAARADDEDDDHDRAMEALQQGRVRPLAEILAEVEQDLGGRVVGVEFDDEEGVYVYEFRMVTDAGRLRVIYVDATSGRILKFEEN
jgi:uncharacterized membrane protein YkoI